MDKSKSDADKPREADGDTSNLPGIGKAANDIVNSKPLADLLGPAFREFGQFGGEWAKEVTDGWRAKRNANVTSHIDAVRKLEGPRPEIELSEMRARLLLEWKGEAEQVDPDAAPELSALWRQLLSSMEANRDSLDQIAKHMEIVKRLNTPTARLLLFGRFPMRIPTTEIEKESVSELVSLDLTTSALFFARPTQLALARWAVPVCMIFALAVQFSFMFLPDVPNQITQTLLKVSVGVTSLSLAGKISWGIIYIGLAIEGWFIVKFAFSRHRLTSAGRTMREQGLRFWKAQQARPSSK